MAVSTAKAAYFGYKAFQAFRLLMGDVTVVAEAVAELLMEGLGEAAVEAAIEASAEHVVDGFQNAADLNKNALKFQTFCAQLSAELGRNNPAAKAVIDKAQQLYQLFVSIDTDGSGTVSRHELRRHCSSLGYTKQVANELFDHLDTDKDGEISFEEFAEMLGPAPGRHEDASKLDCRGQHGLKTFKWKTARACDCCTAEHMVPAAKRITCKDRHGLVKMNSPVVKKCSACQGHIPEMAPMYSCRKPCPVFVCVACVLNVPENLYFTGLRHVR
eukprot:g9191.t1